MEDRTVCQHPITEMRRHGNAHVDAAGTKVHYKWWTCARCHMRWTRTELPQITGGVPQADDVMDFGKYAGQTYGQVYTNHPSYCDWVDLTASHSHDPSTQLKRFHGYIMQRREQRAAQGLIPIPTDLPTDEEGDARMDLDETTSEQQREYPEEWMMTPTRVVNQLSEDDQL